MLPVHVLERERVDGHFGLGLDLLQGAPEACLLGVEVDPGLLGPSLPRLAAGAGEFAPRKLRELQEAPITGAAGVATIVVVEAPLQGDGTLLLSGQGVTQLASARTVSSAWLRVANCCCWPVSWALRT